MASSSVVGPCYPVVNYEAHTHYHKEDAKSSKTGSLGERIKVKTPLVQNLIDQDTHVYTMENKASLRSASVCVYM